MFPQLNIEIAQIDNSLSESAHNTTMESIGAELLIEAHCNLNNIARSLENLVASNTPMTPSFSKVSQHAIQIVSGNSLNNKIVSLEAHTGDAFNQTQMSLEGLKVTLKTIWEKIKLAVKRMLQSVSDFFSKLMGGMIKIENTVKSLQLRADTLSKASLTPSPQTMVINQVDRLMLGGTVNQAVIKEGLKVIDREFYSATTGMFNLVGAYQSQIEKTVQGAGSLEPAALDAFIKLEADMTRDIMGLFKKFEARTELPGGRAIEFKVQGSWFTGGQTLHGIKIIDHPKVKNPPNTVTDKVPSVDWCQNRLDELASLVGQFSKSKRSATMQAYVDQKKKTMKELDSAVKNAGEFEKELAKSARDSVQAILKSMQKDLLNTLIRLDSYTFKYVRSVTLYLNDAITELEKQTT